MTICVLPFGPSIWEGCICIKEERLKTDKSGLYKLNTKNMTSADPIR